MRSPNELSIELDGDWLGGKADGDDATLRLFVGYSGSFENCQIAVYREGASLVEGVWAGGQSSDLGTEEWDAIGEEDPFAGAFATYGTNPGSHAEYRQRVVVLEEAPGLYNVRWYSGTQVYQGTGLLVGNRFAVAAVLTFDERRAHAMWNRRGYALAQYDLATGTGVAVFRDSPDGQPVIGSDQCQRARG